LKAFGVNIEDIENVQAVLKRLYQGEEIKVSQERKIRKVFADISSKVSELNYARVQLNPQRSDYADCQIERVKKIINFKQEIETNGIYWAELKNLKEVLEALLNGEDVANQEIEKANGTLLQIKNYLQQ